MEENKKSCFAYIDKNNCGALIEKECRNCRFYKNKLLEENEITKRLIKEEKERIKNKNS